MSKTYKVYLIDEEVQSVTADSLQYDGQLLKFVLQAELVAAFNVAAVRYILVDPNKTDMIKDINSFLVTVDRDRSNSIDTIKEMRYRFNLTLKSAKAIFDAGIATTHNVEYR